jgi:Fungal Zn(2)-Cys(6) binuclear cluster domain/Fungal specific transcription factor domain
MTKADESKRKRRRHSKSRNGCLHCKKLRVKCDELRPRCQNCINRKKECTYLLSTAVSGSGNGAALTVSSKALTPMSTTSSSSSSASSTLISHRSSSATSSQSPPSPYHASIIGTLIPAECGEPTLLDRELLNHYSNHLAEVVMLTGSPLERNVWEHHIPSLGLGVSYLKHSLMAVSALHLTHASNGTRDMSQLARQQYFKAVQSFGTDSRFGNPEAIFGGSCFVMISSYAFQDIPLLASGHHEIDLLECTRSPMVVSMIFAEALKGTKISNGIIESRGRDNAPVGQLVVIQDLLRIAKDLDLNGFFLHEGLPDDEIAPFSSPFLLSPDLKNYAPYYEGAVEALFECLSPSISGDLPSRILAWPMMLSREFIFLARAGYPFARVIVAFYAAFLHYCQGYFWIAGRGRYEVDKLWAQLDTVWRPLLLWPRAITSTHKLTRLEFLGFLEQRLPRLDFDKMLHVDTKMEPVLLQRIGCP